MFKINKNKILNNTMWLLIVLLLFAFITLTLYTWGRYLFFIICASTALIYAVRNKGRIVLRFDMYQKLFLLFTLYVGLSSLWALRPRDSISQFFTLISLFICYYPIYIFFVDFGTYDSLVSSIKWSGTLVSLYTILVIGINNIITRGSHVTDRFEEGFANANTIGLFSAMAIIIQIWQLLYKKGSKWEAISIIPTIIVLAVTQSRKAVLFTISGIFALIILKNIKEQNILKRFFKILFAVLILLILFLYLSRFELFSGVLHRFQTMFLTITGTSKVDGSTLMRQKLMSVGVQAWLKNPILGIGIGNSHILAAHSVGKDYYLHCNYVELLSGGGILGLLLFYTMHFYCLFKLFKLRKVDNAIFSLTITIVMLTLLMDYGMVSYFAKLQNFYLLISFVAVEKMRKTQQNSLKSLKQGG